MTAASGDWLSKTHQAGGPNLKQCKLARRVTASTVSYRATCRSVWHSMDQNRLKLRRAIERAVSEACNLHPSRLWFGIDEVEITGRPAERIEVWATLRFLPSGGPFCCGEPGCHLALSIDRLREIEELVRAEMDWADAVPLDFGDRIGAQYDADVTFRSDPQSDDSS